MDLFDDFFGAGMGHDSCHVSEINPATGLPMTGDFGSVDVAGNPYGMDLDDHDLNGSHDWLGGIGFDPWDPW